MSQMQPGNGTGSAIQLAPKQKLNNLRDLFDKAKGGLAAVLPKHLPKEKVIRLTLSAASRTPELLNCTPESVLLSVMLCAGLGLEPNTPLGQGYLVPFWNKKTRRKECQFIPGYRGLITLATQSGLILSIESVPVFSGEHFVYERGMDPKLEHIPDIDSAEDDIGDDDKLRCVYAIARFTNGAKAFDVMSRRAINRIMMNSQSYDAQKGPSGPWRDHYVEMAKKTMIRRLVKTLPMSAERDNFQRSLQADAAGAAGVATDYGEVIEMLPAGDPVTAQLAAAAGESTDGTPPEPEVRERSETDVDDPLGARLREKAGQ